MDEARNLRQNRSIKMSTIKKMIEMGYESPILKNWAKKNALDLKENLDAGRRVELLRKIRDTFLILNGMVCGVVFMFVLIDRLTTPPYIMSHTALTPYITMCVGWFGFNWAIKYVAQKGKFKTETSKQLEENLEKFCRIFSIQIEILLRAPVEDLEGLAVNKLTEIAGEIISAEKEQNITTKLKRKEEFREALSVFYELGLVTEKNHQIYYERARKKIASS